jgi:hypothetical protein
MLTVQVPNTKFQLMSWLPLRANSIEEVDAVADDFNKLVEKWSIIK